MCVSVSEKHWSVFPSFSIAWINWLGYTFIIFLVYCLHFGHGYCIAKEGAFFNGKRTAEENSAFCSGTQIEFTSCIITLVCLTDQDHWLLFENLFQVAQVTVPLVSSLLTTCCHGLREQTGIKQCPLLIHVQKSKMSVLWVSQHMLRCWW